ncbi:hypothetical protein A1Q1_07413 [Trichosporon asahii var. asahii CBS 2479]|uniref:Uncharacterized protein n=1 Tax=Trichosporon asahii var. asahii (strain ATCC 90039 / CBS 2479 / JCM 2466 / KCTC 7840 / NBRC 103889/ NCYC 2677 / UAMH 7654) TaxID=1186058 RepID=J5TL42_TRIAS|nr:hypothetical protein A1Q1_07413 [Trichosporon asahii var. asahii CBS 2479]EJT51441.1 hypothetical protein A1Q1_07413 [Trichosporon asahii var. asahii CBS 2479]
MAIGSTIPNFFRRFGRSRKAPPTPPPPPPPPEPVTIADRLLKLFIKHGETIEEEQRQRRAEALLQLRQQRTHSDAFFASLDNLIAKVGDGVSDPDLAAAIYDFRETAEVLFTAAEEEVHEAHHQISQAKGTGDAVIMMLVAEKTGVSSEELIKCLGDAVKADDSYGACQRYMYLSRELMKERDSHREDSRTWAQQKRLLKTEMRRYRAEATVLSEMIDGDMSHVVAAVLDVKRLQEQAETVDSAELRCALTALVDSAARVKEQRKL